jgi:hypothetical protein
MHHSLAKQDKLAHLEELLVTRSLILLNFSI